MTNNTHDKYREQYKAQGWKVTELESRPYTTAEVLAIISRMNGINANTSYINNVIMREARRTHHPLKYARIARGMWDRSIVDKWEAAQERRK